MVVHVALARSGEVLAARGGSKILIGKDTRISGYMFESALEAGISAAGIDVRLLGPLPTPGIAYLTRTLSAQAGIVISASHNAYTDNGIKFFGPDGRKLNDAIEQEIERLLDDDDTGEQNQSIQQNTLSRIDELITEVQRLTGT